MMSDQPLANDFRTSICFFLDNEDGTVTDKRTGLMWMRAALGQVWAEGTCIGVPKTYLWEDAEKIVHHFAGFDDWRLPNLNELSSIIDMANGIPTISTEVFPKAPISCYWTSSPHAYEIKKAWQVNFGNGTLNNTSGFSRNAVRLVRAGPLEHKFNATFLNNGDGTVTHALTGLTWMQCALGQTWNGYTCIGEPNQYTRDEAMSIFHSFAEHSDWRLPSIGELNSIVDRSRYAPAADTSAFPDFRMGNYWTSSSGWVIEFYSGSTVNQFAPTRKPTGNIVRLVRGATISNLILDAVRDRDVSTSLPKKSFTLNVLKTGSGTGDVIGSHEGETFACGKSITLVAAATKDSVFNGWSGDVAGLDNAVTFTVDSAKTVMAEFVKLDIANFEINLAFDSCENASMKSGDEALIIYLLIANKGPKQIHVELPLASYVTLRGEEVAQDAWLSGLLNGKQGANIRADTFRKIGLVFHKSKLNEISAGDHLHLTIAQTKPARRFNFSFRCTEKQSRSFTLINAIEEAVQASVEEAIASSPDMAAMLLRIETLEAGLSEALRKLDALQMLKTAPPAPVEIPANVPARPQTLPDILTWLATQERVSLAVLRRHLLPLDLFPSAVIDEINERALDLIGDVAFEEVGEEIIIAKEVLFEVLAN